MKLPIRVKAYRDYIYKVKIVNLKTNISILFKYIY